MTDDREIRISQTHTRIVTRDLNHSHTNADSVVVSPYRPSSRFRQALRLSTANDLSVVEDQPRGSQVSPTALRAPGLLNLIGVSLAVGVVAGTLELAVLMLQLHWLHYVGPSTIRISRHVAWMVPVAETLVTVGLSSVLVTPVLASSSRRRRGPLAARAVSRTCNWAGAVLGTLLFLGPLLAFRRLHTIAALALAVGLGFRLRRVLVRRTPGWRRASCWAGAFALVGLAVYSFWQWDLVTRAKDRAWSRPTRRAPDLLWIVMDTVRADHMSLYGYERPTTPELQEWAKQGITFDRARSAAAWTLPSHVTMFTGLWPFEHAARIDCPYYGPAPTLAEFLADKGYITAGFAANTRMCNARYGVGRGFDYYVEFLCNQEVSMRAIMLNSTMGTWMMRLAHGIGLPVSGEFPPMGLYRAPQVISHAQEWLDRVHRHNETRTPGSDRPFFLFMNFMDAHSPYQPLSVTASRSGTDFHPAFWNAVPQTAWRARQARDVASPDQRPHLQQELDAVTRRLSDLYDDCLHGLDAELGCFLRELRATGRLENTWVVITSDHGEQFGEHDLFGHGASLYNQVTHVPLILIPPLSAQRSERDHFRDLRGTRIGVPVSHRDLPATLSGLLLPGVATPFPGRSLARHWAPDGPSIPDPILAQEEDQHPVGDDVQTDLDKRLDSVIAEGYLFIESSQRGPELYDLFADPANERNLAGRPEQRSRQVRLNQTLDTLRHPPIRP
jgi:arylsulfatase A-like enzyme